MGMAYSFFKIKALPLVKNIYTGFGIALIFLIGSSGAPFTYTMIIYYFLISLFMTTGSIIADLRDYKGDSETGISSNKYNTTIKNCNLTNINTGISIGGNNVNIINNSISTRDEAYGLNLNSDNSRIINNSLFDNWGDGFRIDGQNNIIRGNYFANNTYSTEKVIYIYDQASKKNLHTIRLMDTQNATFLKYKYRSWERRDSGQCRRECHRKTLEKTGQSPLSTATSKLQ